MNAINLSPALYVHLQYLPTDLRAMPHFPDIGKANPYLMSRSDNSVIDAMPYATNDVSELMCIYMLCTTVYLWPYVSFMEYLAYCIHVTLNVIQ